MPSWSRTRLIWAPSRQGHGGPPSRPYRPEADRHPSDPLDAGSDDLGPHPLHADPPAERMRVSREAYGATSHRPIPTGAGGQAWPRSLSRIAGSSVVLAAASGSRIGPAVDMMNAVLLLAPGRRGCWLQTESRSAATRPWRNSSP